MRLNVGKINVAKDRLLGNVSWLRYFGRSDRQGISRERIQIMTGYNISIIF